MRLVQRGVPRVLVCLHEVYLSTGNAADLVRIAVVVLACGSVHVLAHGHHVEGSVATTPCSREVHSELDSLVQQVDGQVLAVVVDAARTRVREVGTRAHVRHQPAVLDLDVHHVGQVPTSGDERDLAMALKADPPRAECSITSGWCCNGDLWRRCRGEWRLHRRCCADRLHTEAGKLDGLGARIGRILGARPQPIGTLAVHPQHVV
mmetsp:Transcript_68161/g.158178  ORF Transcript_68161/g.158178 Transcript_68161/m.158178 type:complete len:206 (+) Transcript_68161:578-1195(+)